METNYYINIGSNLGNKMLNISRAVSMIEKEFGWFELSKPVKSEPWGYESVHNFVNIGMRFISEKDPLEILHILQKIERRISPLSHRKKDGTYADRIIDIDIMAADGIEMATPELTLPHPHLHDRDFFLNTYNELRQR